MYVHDNRRVRTWLVGDHLSLIENRLSIKGPLDHSREARDVALDISVK